MQRAVLWLALGTLLGGSVGLSLGLRPLPAIAGRARAPGVTATEGPNPAAPVEQPGPAPATVSGAAFRTELTHCLSSPNPVNRWSEIEGTLERWAESDAREALAFVDAAPRFPLRQCALAIPLAAIARQDPPAVVAWLREHSGETDRRRLADLIVAAISETNPREAIVLARTADLGSHGYLLAYPMGRLAAENPAEALAVLATTRGLERVQSAEMIGTAWARQDPEAALNWCATLPDPATAGAAANGILVQLAESDPSAAAAALLRLQPPTEATCSALRAIAQVQPALALECLSALDPAVVPEATRALAHCAFSSAPDEFASRLRTHLPADEFTPALRQSWTTWCDSDRRAAEAWADQVADSELRARLVDLRLADSAGADPLAFLATLESVPDAHLEPESIRTALDNLPPADAARWVASHPALAPAEMTLQVARTFAATDSAAAAAWANTLPPGALRDRTLANLATGTTSVAQLAESERTLAAIGDAQIRTAVRFQVFTTLQREDPTVANAWLATQPLAPEVRASWAAIAAANLEPVPAEGHCD